MEFQELYDITIVGAGPTGLFSAFYAGMRRLKTKIIETLPEPGGQLGVLYPEKLIYDVPGHYEIKAKDLTREQMRQIARFPVTLCFQEQVEALERVEDNNVIVIQTNKARHYTRALIVTVGIGAFAPTKLKAERADQFESRGLDYYLQDINNYRGKRVLIVGGGERAVGWAIDILGVASKVFLIHHKDHFKGEEEQVQAAQQAGVEIRRRTQVRAIRGNVQIEAVTLFNNETNETSELEVQALLVNQGYKANLGLMQKWNLKADRRYIPVNARMETNVPGIYAAGGVVRAEGAEPLDLIATGFGQAAVAINYAARYIDPSASLFPGHSSEMKF